MKKDIHILDTVKTTSQTVVVEMNKEALLHFLKYLRGIYVYPHSEGGEKYEAYECPYCITLLIVLDKAKGEAAIKDKIHNLRVLAKRRKKKLSVLSQEVG